MAQYGKRKWHKKKKTLKIQKVGLLKVGKIDMTGLDVPLLAPHCYFLMSCK